MTHRLSIKRHNWPLLVTLYDEKRFCKFQTFFEELDMLLEILFLAANSSRKKSLFFRYLVFETKLFSQKVYYRKTSRENYTYFFVYFEDFNDFLREIKSSFFQFLMTRRLVYSMKLDLHFGPQNGILNSFIKDKFKIKARPWLIYEINEISKNKF